MRSPSLQLCKLCSPNLPPVLGKLANGPLAIPGFPWPAAVQFVLSDSLPTSSYVVPTQQVHSLTGLRRTCGGILCRSPSQLHHAFPSSNRMHAPSVEGSCCLAIYTSLFLVSL